MLCFSLKEKTLWELLGLVLFPEVQNSDFLKGWRLMKSPVLLAWAKTAPILGIFFSTSFNSQGCLGLLLLCRHKVTERRKKNKRSFLLPLVLAAGPPSPAPCNTMADLQLSPCSSQGCLGSCVGFPSGTPGTATQIKSLRSWPAEHSGESKGTSPAAEKGPNPLWGASSQVS